MFKVMDKKIIAINVQRFYLTGPTCMQVKGCFFLKCFPYSLFTIRIMGNQKNCLIEVKTYLQANPFSQTIDTLSEKRGYNMSAHVK